MTDAFQLGRYRLFEIIGRGGFGTIYRAEDTILHVPRAVKILHPALSADPVFLERFRQEARMAARYEHPHIVPVFELDQIDGSFFLVMRLMEGGTLKDLLGREGRLSFDRALHILEQTGKGLDYAHSLPETLIHRDIKPGNILFEPDGTVRISDLGFAKALKGASSETLSITGGLIGTPAYMPPEMWQDQVVGPPADLYSLSCVFYEMLTGEVLFPGSTPAEIMTRHVISGPVFPPIWPEGVPQGIEAALRRSFSPDPADRYPTCNALVEAIRAATASVAISPHQPTEGDQGEGVEELPPDLAFETDGESLPLAAPGQDGPSSPADQIGMAPQKSESDMLRTDPAATRLQMRPVFEPPEPTLLSERPVITAPEPDQAQPESDPNRPNRLPWIIAGMVLILACCCLVVSIWIVPGLLAEL